MLPLLSHFRLPYVSLPVVLPHHRRAIDPGFAHGCKCAVIDPAGRPLATSTVYPHPPQRRLDGAKAELLRLLRQHRVSIVGIGNGTACRETEAVVLQLKCDLPDLAVTIVNEAGASVYSVSAEAAAELPGRTPAECGARRLQDPLAELVKIDPQSLGIGMYQHDSAPKLLAKALEDVVGDCVALVCLSRGRWGRLLRTSRLIF
jgi:protein Tex